VSGGRGVEQLTDLVVGGGQLGQGGGLQRREELGPADPAQLDIEPGPALGELAQPAQTGPIAPGHAGRIDRDPRPAQTGQSLAVDEQFVRRRLIEIAGQDDSPSA
jgi:hypothetical protein